MEKYLPILRNSPFFKGLTDIKNKNMIYITENIKLNRRLLYVQEEETLNDQ